MAEPHPRWNPRTVERRLRASGYQLEGALPPVAWFGDDPAMARELGELVRSGRKRATAGLRWKWEADGWPLPSPGDRQVIIDWDGEPLAVIEFTAARVVPFDQVDAEFAAAEGEGDRSLAYWRDVHWRFFTREARRIGREPTTDMPTLCLRFRLVHAVSRPGGAAGGP